eukprot:737-Pelagomonas_calceolata.AAC.4
MPHLTDPPAIWGDPYPPGSLESLAMKIPGVPPTPQTMFNERASLDENTHTNFCEDADFELHITERNTFCADTRHFSAAPAVHAVKLPTKQPYQRHEWDPLWEEPEHQAYLNEVPVDDEEAELQADGAIQGLDKTADIFTDLPTMHYLRHNQLPPDADKHKRDRILRRAKVNHQGPDRHIYHTTISGQTRIIPPPEQPIPLVAHWHEQCCHFGVKRTFSLLAQHFWWYGMGNQVRYVVRHCSVSDRANTAFTAKTPQLQPLPMDGLFFHWNIDLAGPIPTPSAYGNNYILIAVEHMSKWLVTVPIPDKTTATVSKAFTDHILTIFGSSAQVLTDQGGEFQGEFQDMCIQYKIDDRQTSPNCPQSDGLAERAVQTVKKALRKHLVSDPRKSWDKKLP